MNYEWNRVASKPGCHRVRDSCARSHGLDPQMSAPESNRSHDAIEEGMALIARVRLTILN